MRSIGFVVIVTAALLGACSQTTAPPSPLAVPDVPEPPQGWVSTISFAGSGSIWSEGEGGNGEPVALAVSCRGFGDLIIILGHARTDDEGLRRSVLAPCSGSLDETVTRRFELGPLEPDERVIHASIVGDDVGPERHAYAVSLEHPVDR